MAISRRPCRESPHTWGDTTSNALRNRVSRHRRCARIALLEGAGPTAARLRLLGFSIGCPPACPRRHRVAAVSTAPPSTANDGDRSAIASTGAFRRRSCVALAYLSGYALVRRGSTSTSELSVAQTRAGHRRSLRCCRLVARQRLRLSPAGECAEPSSAESRARGDPFWCSPHVGFASLADPGIAFHRLASPSVCQPTGCGLTSPTPSRKPEGQTFVFRLTASY